MQSTNLDGFQFIAFALMWIIGCPIQGDGRGASILLYGFGEEKCKGKGDNHIRFMCFNPLQRLFGTQLSHKLRNMLTEKRRVYFKIVF
jgi:hypothetical protein